jgi:hypothetical protein
VSEQGRLDAAIHAVPDGLKKERMGAGIMPIPRRRLVASVLLLGGSLAIGNPPCRAQGLGSSAPLGGYGAVSGYANPGMGGSSPMIIPYAGMFDGFMPSRMGGGSALSFRSRPNAALESSRTSFRLSPLSGGMSAMSGSPGGFRAIGRATSPLGSRGRMGLGGGTGLGSMPRMRSAGGASVMPPSIGYPFRQPPSLLGPSTSGTGMSM